MSTTHKKEKKAEKPETLLTRMWTGEEITPTDFTWKMKLKH
jgi:hypothetical protein